MRLHPRIYRGDTITPAPLAGKENGSHANLISGGPALSRCFSIPVVLEEIFKKLLFIYVYSWSILTHAFAWKKLVTTF